MERYRDMSFFSFSFEKGDKQFNHLLISAFSYSFENYSGESAVKKGRAVEYCGSSFSRLNLSEIAYLRVFAWEFVLCR
jgi:hypothetical protein